MALAAQLIGLPDGRPAPLDCPRGQTVWIVGDGHPGQAVLVLVAGRVVGGGNADSTGRWQIPLTMNEPPGSYVVQVVDRETRQPQAEHVCLVGPEAGASTQPAASAPASGVAPKASATPRLTGPKPTATMPQRTPTILARTPPMTVEATSSPTPGAAAGVEPSAPPNRIPSATLTARPTTDPRDLITPSPTAVAGVADRLSIAEVMAGDPESLEEGPPDYGYVEIRLASGDPVDLTGWQLANLTHPARPTFTFPNLLLSGNGAITVLPDSGASTDELIYWGIEQIVWESGTHLALRTPQGVDALTVAIP